MTVEHLVDMVGIAYLRQLHGFKVDTLPVCSYSFLCSTVNHDVLISSFLFVCDI